MATAYVSPRWVKTDSDPYKRLFNRKANSLIKRHRKRGGTYRVNKAMDAIHEAMHGSTAFIHSTLTKWIQSCFGYTTAPKAKSGEQPSKIDNSGFR